MVTPNFWLTCPRPNPQAHLRLFCFPYAGAGASVFRSWSDELSLDVEVYAVQLPGRETRLRESPFTRISPLIETLAQVLLPYLDLPFAFFGHSMGALVSFELARQLRRQKSPSPLHLFVSSRRAPQLPNPYLSIHHLPDTALIEELHRYNGTPQAVLQDPELRSLFLPLLRADLAVIETYIYMSEAPLDCSISAFGGLQDREASRKELAAWRDQTSKTFTLRMFPGDHFFLKRERYALLRVISQDLRRIATGHIEFG
ncbi:thioesterase [Pleurocapsales cyanobacterium LEGE 06147]|nr:thioesterase [Pleurocapsales cyanobacterium LEGE 06147]